jgi:hypothetical protein
MIRNVSFNSMSTLIYRSEWYSVFKVLSSVYSGTDKESSHTPGEERVLFSLFRINLFLRFPYHHHRRNCHFWAMAFLRRFCQIWSGFHFFGFRNSNCFAEQGRQYIAQHPTWRTRSLYLCPPVTGWPSYAPRHRLLFSSPTTRRGTVEVF